MNSAHLIWYPAAMQFFGPRQWLAPFLTLCLMGSAHAQNDETAATDPSANQFFQQQDDGTYVSLQDLGIPPKAVEQFLEWLTTQQSVPHFEISMVNATGHVSEQRVDVHVELQVEVHVKDEWVRVPVEFNQWTVKQFQHSPKESGFASRFNGNASANREWLLKGKGSHILSFDLVGDVREQEADRHRLKISMPDAVVSELKLTCDELIENVQGNTDALPTVESTDQFSTMTFWRLKPETDISWQSSLKSGAQSAVISTPDPAEMELDLTSNTPILTCLQTITITDGAIDKLNLQLPPGYGHPEITGLDENGRVVIQPGNISMSNDDSTASIAFTKQIRRSMKLTVVMGLQETAFPQNFSVSVPALEGVASQSAKVTIRKPTGLDVRTSFPPGQPIRRSQVESQADDRSEALAFDLLSTEATLTIEVREPEARFTVKPQLDFSTDGQRLVLSAAFPINVSPGSLDELQIDWKRYVEDGWKIDPGTIYLHEDDVNPQKLSYIPTEDEDAITLLLGKYCSGQFSVEFQASRSLETAENNGAFHLPNIETNDAHSTIVSLIESDTYSLSLTKAKDDSGYLVDAPNHLSVSENLKRATRWQVPDSDSAVRIVQSRQTPEVSSTATVALNVKDEIIHVHTEIHIDVRHRDLRELRCTVCDGVVGIPMLHLSGYPNPLMGSLLGDEYVWRLPEPIRGPHTASIDYVWTLEPLPEDIDLPLALPTDGLESLEIRTHGTDIISVAGDDTLRRKYSKDFKAAWYTNQPPSQVTLQIPQSLSQHQTQTPLICLVETHVAPSVIKSSTTAFFETSPESVQFSVPNDVGVTAAVNGQAVDRTLISSVPTDSTTVLTIRIPQDLSRKLVWVQLTSHKRRNSHHHLLSKEIVDHPRIVGAPEWLTTVWTIGTGDGTQLISMKAQHDSVFNQTGIGTLFMSSSNRISRSIETTLTGLPNDVRSRFRTQFDNSDISKRASLGFITGPELQTVPVVLYSQAMGWVIAAALGVFFYTVLISLQRHLRLLTILLIPVCVLAWAALPHQALALLFPILPALVVAVVAWLYRQFLMPSENHRRSRHQRKSIFTSVTPPSQTDPKAAITDAITSPAPISVTVPPNQ